MKACHDICLTIRNDRGSVEHYYHFFLGFLLPLVKWYQAVEDDPQVRHVHVRSCAIFDRILLETALPKIRIIDRDRHFLMRSSRLTPEGIEIVQCSIDGWDHPRLYAHTNIHPAVAFLQKRLAPEIQRVTAGIRREITDMKNLLLVIDRGAADPYYATDSAEIKTSGRERRSLPNFGEIVTSLTGHNVLATTLENRSLAFQMAVFGMAKAVIAQHGASLANMVFAAPDSFIFEILPADLGEELTEIDFFGNLARTMGMRYKKIDQETSHSPVAPQSILRALPEFTPRLLKH